MLLKGEEEAGIFPTFLHSQALKNSPQNTARIETRCVGSVSLAVIALRGFEVSPLCHHQTHFSEAAVGWVLGRTGGGGKNPQGRVSTTLTFIIEARESLLRPSWLQVSACRVAEDHHSSRLS